MAGQEPGFGFTGSLHSISACKRRDMDTIIIRSKRGPSKRMINSHPSFELTRRNNKEFGGRSTASKWIRRILYLLKPPSDYNISGPLNSTLKPIQQMDTISEPEKETSGFPKTHVCRKAFSSSSGIFLNPFSVVQQAHWDLCNNYSFII